METASNAVILGRLRVLELEGIYVAMLESDELAMFNEACRAGIAYRSYNCLGLAKVGIR